LLVDLYCRFDPVREGQHARVNTRQIRKSQIAVLEGHTDEVVSAAFSPDGIRLVTASTDGAARIWDAGTGSPIAKFHSHGPVVAAAFSPNGKRLVTASPDSIVQVWDALTGQALTTIRHLESLRSVSFSRDGLHLLADDFAGNFVQWSAANGQLERAFDGAALGVSRGVFRGDGALFVGDGRKGPAIVWESSTGHVIATLPHEDTGGRILAINPGGDRAAVGLNDGRILLWNFSGALAPLNIVIREACGELDRKENGRRFSKLEIASDALISEAWLHGDHQREVCKQKTNGRQLRIAR
jgi:WD40 repeat protein